MSGPESGDPALGAADARTLAVYDAHAGSYADRLAMTPEDDAGFAAFAAALPPGPVLDLGCGPGTWAAALMAKGRAVAAWDASPGMVAAARARGVPARLAGFDALDARAEYAGVWANFSLLHAPRAALPGHIAAIRRALVAGGLLHIGMKTGTGAARDALGRLYTYVTEAELDGWLAGSGFTILRRETGASPGLDGATAPWIVLLARADG